MDSLKLSASALRALAQARGITVNASSPIGRGPGAGAPPDVALPPELQEGLQILAQPEAMVRLKVMVPGEPEVAALGAVVRGDRAARFTIDGDTVEVTPAASLEAIASAVAHDVVHQGPLAGQETFLWPSTLKIMSLLWQDTQDPAQPVARADALARLKAGGPPEEVAKALDELVRAGLLQARGEQLHINPPLQPWLALVWSGHALHVEYLPLPADVPFEKAAQAQGEHVLFVGPPGQRILSIQVTGEALAQRTQGGAPVEDALVRLSAPREELIEKALGLLFRMRAQPAPVAG
jgi:hypothetical protein